jgi:hypothetical protein
MGFYFQWKYPKTSRKLTKFTFVFLALYIPVYFLFIHSPKELIKPGELTMIQGSIERIEFSIDQKDHFESLRIKEIPGKEFHFDETGRYSNAELHEGDSVSILALTLDLQAENKIIRAFDLRQSNQLIFTVDDYNTALRDDKNFLQIFLWIAIVFVILYLIIELSNFVPRILKKLDSPDPDFHPPSNVNFNEFLEDNPDARE